MEKHSSRRKHESGIRRLEKQLKLWNIHCLTCSSPTKVLGVGNAGLACGFSEQDVINEIAKIFTLQTSLGQPIPRTEVTMIADKQFSLISCENESAAEQIHQSISGRSFTTSFGSEFPWFPAYLADFDPRQTPDLLSPKQPPGLHYYPEFVSPEEEHQLIGFVECALQNVPSKDVLRNRTALHYGFRFLYGSNNVDMKKETVEPIPAVCDPLRSKLVALGLFERPPDQLTINIYQPGQGIPAHVDTHSVFENGICSISLGSPVVMNFSRGSATLPVVLQPRSALIMKDECRYAWKHGITPRTTDVIPGNNSRRGRRISLTFRCVRNHPCTCAYPDECDSQYTRPSDHSRANDENAGGNQEISSELSLEESHVYQVYEDIAAHFSQTRYKPWPKVVEFVESIPCGGVVADVGCGNGKYLGLSKQIFEVGCDRSVNLIDICRDRKLEVLISDVLSLPFRDGCCDGVLCIAVIHHLSSQERRIKALRELVRVLSVNGSALVYVWALEQKKDQRVSTYLKGGGKPSTSSKDGGDEREQTLDVLPTEARLNTADSSDGTELPIHTNRTQFKQQDILVPWHLKPKRKECDAVKQDEKVFHRYYHVFREGELEEYCECLDNIEILQSYYDEGNWCIVLRRCF
ncbi:alkylated DNA repair protein alkB homolog 8-like [Paramacrobiotus metropolitanus]|uniref:alkylated DNA repair protein alkB homolog 8-like n=1 Tax=Paramacrobiotus metropolitanus TaxID=2943436 RepID=UPI0024462F95|nr:alkylated DNA repair protein alkB homolog 8-like [Paramacrobiotus metropolitanus]